MQLIYIIAIPLVILIFFIVLSLKTDWKEIDKHNRQYYVGGYHIGGTNSALVIRKVQGNA